MPPKRTQHYRHLPAFILLALAEGPGHGGAVLSLLTSRMPCVRPDSAAVYRTLQQLEEAGEVSAAWDTSGSGPARKRYELTTVGWCRLDHWREEIEMRVASLTHFLDTHRALTERRRRDG
jgi:DNA-binding PadR family transcriptional regulator